MRIINSRQLDAVVVEQTPGEANDLVESTPLSAITPDKKVRLFILFIGVLL
ncbi:MAG: hypothetical protein ACRC1Z_18080 [Waterburya sp.]